MNMGIRFLVPACTGISSGAGVASTTSETLRRVKTDPCSGRAAARGSVSSTAPCLTRSHIASPFGMGAALAGTAKVLATWSLCREARERSPRT